MRKRLRQPHQIPLVVCGCILIVGCSILALDEGDFDADAIPGDYSAIYADLELGSGAALISPDPAFVFDLEFTADGRFSGRLTFPEPLPDRFGGLWGGGTTPVGAAGGGPGGMETGYQRGKIQAESMLDEHRNHAGSLPLIGVNTFLNPQPAATFDMELARSTEAEKQSQISRLGEFQSRHSEQSANALQRLRAAATNDENVFTELMQAVRYCSLGQITHTFFEVGGQYRRNM